MASDNDKSSDYNFDGSLKNINKKGNNDNFDEDEEKAFKTAPVGKGGRHLSIPFDSTMTNGDLAKKQNGSAVRTNSLGSGARTPPAERTKSKFSAFGRLFKPWKWKRKKKSEKFEAASRTLERKISVRANRDELVQKGILLPESPVTPVPEANEELSPVYGGEEARAETNCGPDRMNAMHVALQAQLASQLAQQQAALAAAVAAAAHHQNNNVIEPKKDKLENGGETTRPERPNSLTAGKHPRRICYQGDVGGYNTRGEGGDGEEPLVLSELPEPPIALSEIGPIPPPPMFSSPSPTRHHHQHTMPQHPHSDSEEEDDPEEEDVEPLALAGDTSRIEEIPPKEPLYNAMPLKSALKKRPAPSASPAATPLAARQDHHHASFKRPPPKPRIRICSRPIRVGNAMENKENARPWDGEYRDDYTSESERVAAKLARKESLNIKLALRPDRQELINRNILVVQSEHERQESWEAIGARLIRRLSMRPTAEELVERNILKSQSPAEEKKQKEEKKRYLLRKLSFRPTVDELKEKKIIRFSDYIEVTQAHDYDRRADKPWTRLTPRDKAAIRRELNEFKSSEMAVHEDSKHLTRFHRP
ncbi:phosphatase and actin regulator 4B isoform X3 [Bombyx mandarina]|uniref:Phosphatase and actin regulator 4B isoform X3 n=1 Tax=Bombyx mandarina TaxID=7092 RepID=A0A6J2JQP6_BOMMA|nr:phosphatase and actin regulator 4B isoform X3 [Bombyx mandarina]